MKQQRSFFVCLFDFCMYVPVSKCINSTGFLLFGRSCHFTVTWVSGTWQNFYAQNGGVGDKDFMHSLTLLFRRFRRGIHLPNVQNGRPALEGLQVSPPSEWNICLHSTILHTASLGLCWNRKIGPQFTSFSLHLALHGFPLLHPCPLSPRLSVSGDLRRAVKSTHVSLAGSSIRAELR